MCLKGRIVQQLVWQHYCMYRTCSFNVIYEFCVKYNIVEDEMRLLIYCPLYILRWPRVVEMPIWYWMFMTCAMTTNNHSGSLSFLVYWLWLWLWILMEGRVCQNVLVFCCVMSVDTTHSVSVTHGAPCLLSKGLQCSQRQGGSSSISLCYILLGM